VPWWQWSQARAGLPGNFQSATGSVRRVHATSLQRIGDKLRVPHNFELPPLLHPTTEAIAAVIVAKQDANWNFVIDQGATETFASDRTLHYRQLL
jgi:hypothetical protein